MSNVAGGQTVARESRSRDAGRRFTIAGAADLREAAHARKPDDVAHLKNRLAGLLSAPEQRPASPVRTTPNLRDRMGLDWAPAIDADVARSSSQRRPTDGRQPCLGTT